MFIKKKTYVLLLLIIMFFTNPTKPEFNEWVKNEAVKKYGSSFFEQAIVGALAPALVDALTVRHNYYVLSVYEIREPSFTGKSKVAGRVIGAFKIFIPLPGFKS